MERSAGANFLAWSPDSRPSRSQYRQVCLEEREREKCAFRKLRSISGPVWRCQLCLTAAFGFPHPSLIMMIQVSTTHSSRHFIHVRVLAGCSRDGGPPRDLVSPPRTRIWVGVCLVVGGREQPLVSQSAFGRPSIRRVCVCVCVWPRRLGFLPVPSRGVSREGEAAGDETGRKSVTWRLGRGWQQAGFAVCVRCKADRVLTRQR